MCWPMVQVAAAMAPKVIKVIHTPNTRQGVNTQVREIPLFPADSMTVQCLEKARGPVQVWDEMMQEETKYSRFILKYRYNILVIGF